MFSSEKPKPWPHWTATAQRRPRGAEGFCDVPRPLWNLVYKRQKDTGERMSSFLGVLRKVAMFHKERKQVTIKQTTSPQKAGNSVTSGNSYPKSSKKDQIGRGRVPYHGAITERDFENIHHRIVRTSKASPKNTLKQNTLNRVLVLVKVSLLCLRYRCILFCKIQ